MSNILAGHSKYPINDNHFRALMTKCLTSHYYETEHSEITKFFRQEFYFTGVMQILEENTWYYGFNMKCPHRLHLLLNTLHGEVVETRKWGITRAS